MANNQTFTLNIKALFDASDVRAKVGEIQNAFKSLKLPDNLKNSLSSSFNNVEKALNDFESRTAKGVKTKADATGLTRSMDKVISEFTKLSGVVDKVKAEISNTSDLSKIIQIDDATIQKIGKLKKEISDLQEQISEINASKIADLENKLSKISGKKAGEYGKQALNLFKQGDIEGAIKLLDEVIERYKKLQGGDKEDGRFSGIIAGFEQLKEGMDKAKTNVAPLMDEINQKSQQIGSEMSGAFEKTNKAVNDGATALNNYTSQASGARGEVDGLGKAQAQLNTELDQIKSRIVYFLGLSNAVNLFKRSIRSAFNTVKELDAAMTETAVVTDKTISDMWKQLPEYTARANSLGVTTLDAYKAATLYYQQGLNDQQTAELSVETLRMARIAGLEAADATDRMTNALRGFNMELNAMNAQRIDDVYSQLAAMSASNVDEISTAMTKVASLAHNANMDFETTAAFLAQIIETTRESAETAGTALKTVVARFSEVKKLVSEDQLKGQDEEGQVIDVNKVSQALRTAGIDLNKYFIGEVGLDDIFMELASKWDSLTSVQQRYIATQAAGSRQQSRFIAMMQDYARTQELVSAAYNSNGASARQFEKTQDSLQSKLARLKNAWDAFLMGITNNGIIKGAVDVLTLLLNVLNKIADAFGPAASGAIKFGMALGSLAALRKIFVTSNILTKLLGGLGNSPVGKLFGLGGNKLKGSETTSATSAGDALAKGGQAGAAALEKGAMNAAATIEAAATKSAAIEESGAAEETTTEVTGGKVETTTEVTGGEVETTTEVSGGLKETAIELAGAVKKAAVGIWSKAKDLGLWAGVGKAGLMGGTATVGSGLAGLGLMAAGIGTIALAAYGAYKWIKAMYDATPKGQLKIAEKYAKAIGKVADNSQKAAQEMREVQQKTQDYEQQLEQVVSNADRRKIIQEQNEYLVSLMGQDSKYAQYITTSYTAEGQLRLTLDKDAFDKAVEEANKSAVQASAFSNLSLANVEEKRIPVLQQDQLRNVDLKARTYEKLVDTDYDEVADTYVTTKLTDEEYARQAAIQAQIDAAEIASKSYRNTAVGSLVGLYGNGANQELLGLVTNAFTESFNWDAFDDRVQEIQSDLDLSDTERRAEYQTLYGHELGEDFDEDEVDRAIAYGRAVKEQIDGQIPELINIAKDANGQAILQVLAGTFDGTNKEWSEALDKVLSNNEYADALAKMLNVSTEELRATLITEYGDIRKSQAETRRKLVNKLVNAGLRDMELISKASNELKISEIRQLEQFTEDLAEYSPEFRVRALEEATNAMLAGKWEGSDLEKLFANFENPILTLRALQEAASGTDKELQTIAQDLLEIAKQDNLFSDSNLLQYFLTSAEYTEKLNGEISKLIEENGKINSHNIEKLAEDSEILNALLEEGSFNAQGLANAINAFEAGNITINDLNDRVVELYNSFDSVANAVERAGYFIKNFNPGEDYGDAMDFITEAKDKMTEMVQNRELGNEQLWKYWEAFFGTSPDENTVEDWEQGLEVLQQLIDSDGLDFWTDYLGFSSEKTADGDILLDTNVEGFAESEFDSYRDYIKNIAESNGWNFSDEFYDLMLRSLKNHDYGAYRELAEAELNKIIEQYEGVSPTKADIQAIADAYGIDPEKLYQAWYDKYGKEKEGAPKKYEDLQETRIKTDARELYNLIPTELQQGWETDWTVSDSKLPKYLLETLGIDENGVFSLDTLKLRVEELVPEVANGSISAEDWLNKEVFNGEPVKIGVEAEVTSYNAEEGKYEIKKVPIEIEASNYDEAARLYAAAVEREQNRIIQEENFSWTSGYGDSFSSALISAWNTFKEEVERTPIEAKVKLTPDPAKFVVTGSGGGNINFTMEVQAAAAKGGIVKSAANGAIEPGLALTGEEAPEIVWNKEKGYAYLAGKNGPEINNLQPGDQVFNGEQTRQILKRSGISSFAKGTINSYAVTKKRRIEIIDGELVDTQGIRETTSSRTGKDTPIFDKAIYTGDGKSGDKGGNNNSKSSKDWKNELDWLYDLMEDIAEEEHKQTLIQSEYELAEKDLAKTGRDLYNLTKAELDTLQAQLSAQQFAFEKRLQQMNELQQKVVAEGFEEYLRWNPEDNSLEIDWDKINEITDKDTYDKLSDLVSDMEKVQDQMDEAQEATLDIKKQIQELQTRYLQAYLDFQNRVMEAVVAQYQQNIDSLSELNDTINEANESILDSIQKEIDLQRQIRDNTDTEKEIADMEARLAMLQRDTTGANQQEILELQKQLDEARENYSDTLVDQAIDRLSQNNDDAQEQREKQIELLEAQLEYWQETGALWEEVAKLIADGFTSQGSIIQGSELWEFLKDADSWNGLSQAQKENWANELILESAQVGAYLTQLNDGVDISTDRIIDSIIGEHGLAGEITAETRIVRAQLNELIAKLGGTPIDSIPGDGGYASGGLATKTGLAMLHGTTNEPEYVLNARQTGAFLRLADVLPSIFGSGTGTTNNYGTNVYVELNMSVGEIGSDYDVDRLVARVKDDIYDASSYRNVNAVSFLR